MIGHNFNTEFTVKRMTWSGESSSEITVLTFKGMIQPAKQELTASLHLTFTKTFVIYCAIDSGVKEGDRIEDGNYTYSVKYATDRSYGSNPHKQLIVERNEDYYSA